MKDLLASKTKIIGLILAFLVLVVMPPFYTSYWVTLLTQMLIYGILAMSLDILIGYTGLSSFGHAGFFGSSAYVVAILSTRYKMGFLICLVSGIAVTTVISMIFGLLVAHATGVYFLIITLALGMVLWGLAFRWVGDDPRGQRHLRNRQTGSWIADLIEGSSHVLLCHSHLLSGLPHPDGDLRPIAFRP